MGGGSQKDDRMLADNLGQQPVESSRSADARPPVFTYQVLDDGGITDQRLLKRERGRHPHPYNASSSTKTAALESKRSENCFQRLPDRSNRQRRDLSAD